MADSMKTLASSGIQAVPADHTVLQVCTVAIPQGAICVVEAVSTTVQKHAMFCP